jgi:membrane-associated phospholipid phosphatase
MAEYTAGLDEVVALTKDGLTPEQLAIVLRWAPQGAAYMNSVAAEMIVDYHRSEREAARILALANMAGFDVLNACFDAKFAYYYVRPTQASSQAKLAIALPNHPSYPSGHSCLTAAYATVLASAFPEETERLEAMTEEAGRSRMYGGLHYLFDCIVGQNLGRKVAAEVMRTAPAGRGAIPLD